MCLVPSQVDIILLNAGTSLPTYLAYLTKRKEGKKKNILFIKKKKKKKKKKLHC
jgi:type I restriction-modification system DNA methylase subunit